MASRGVYTEQFTCAQCGKTKYRNGAWTYKRKVATKTAKSKSKHYIYFCGYSCMRAWDKEREKK